LTCVVVCCSVLQCVAAFMFRGFGGVGGRGRRVAGLEMCKHFKSFVLQAA